MLDVKEIGRGMTPLQKLKWAILVAADDRMLQIITAENIDQIYAAKSEDDDTDDIQDALYEVRDSGEDTGLECDWDRNYESKAVAAQMPDGTWVGWTYWYGGGKYGQPEAIEWMEEAYNVECVEEKRIVRIFSRSKNAL